jgi:hypothetical protein
MWHSYRKSLIPIQVVILAVCVFLYWQMKVPILAILYYFAVMQVFAVLGAMWSTRLRNKFETSRKNAKMRKLA